MSERRWLSCLSGEPADEEWDVPASDPALKLRVQTWGDVGATCLFLHGFGEGAFVWEGVATAAAKGLRTAVVDLRGHGDSSWDPHHRYEFDHHVADVARVVAALGKGPMVLCGHSLGAAIAVEAAAPMGASLRGLALVDYAPDASQDGADQVSAAFEADNGAYESAATYLDRLRANRHLAHPDRLRHMAREALRRRPDGRFELKRDPALLASRERERARADAGRAWAALRTLRPPVLILRGAGSSILPAAVAQRAAAELRDGRVEEVPMAGHSVMTDNPEGFVLSLRAFIGKLALAG